MLESEQDMVQRRRVWSRGDTLRNYCDIRTSENSRYASRTRLQTRREAAQIEGPSEIRTQQDARSFFPPRPKIFLQNDVLTVGADAILTS